MRVRPLCHLSAPAETYHFSLFLSTPLVLSPLRGVVLFVIGFCCMSTWFVYVVRCKDRSLYTGISTDVEQRVMRHNEGKGAAYTRGRKPVSLVWSEEAHSESSARKREAQIKRFTRIKKEHLVQGLTK